MMPKNKVLLSAFQRVLVSWGDVDLTVPAFAAQRIRFSLQNQKLHAHGHLGLEHGQRSTEPRPVPWRLSHAAAATIEAVTQMTQLVSLMPKQVAAETGAALSQSLMEFSDDDGCPTGRIWRWPSPRPKFDELVSFDSADLIVSAVLFHAAAEVSSDEQLATEFAGIADRFLERGLQGQ